MVSGKVDNAYVGQCEIAVTVNSRVRKRVDVYPPCNLTKLSTI